MQGTFILAIIVALLAAAAGFAWLISRGQVKHREAAFARRQQPEPAQAAAGTGRHGDLGERMYSRGYDEPRSADTDGPAQVAFWAKWVALGLAGLAGLLVVVSAFNPVGTQDIGVVQSFGRPVAYVGNGAQWTLPWETVTDMDYAIQVTDFTASSCDIQLRLADGQTACAKVAVRWRINKTAADTLFRNYKGSTAGIENGLLIPELQNTANQVFASYDPVALLNSTAKPGSPDNPTVPQLATQVQTQLSDKIGSDVTIISLFIPNITYSPTVQARINAVLAQKADTLVAQQSEQTALAQAQANKDIAASVSANPAVNESRCLDIMQQIVKAGNVPPVNMCNLGGSSSGVIVSAGSGK